MAQIDHLYASLIERIEQDGHDKMDRTKTGTRSLFAERMEFDLTEGRLPLLTTKRVWVKGAIEELLWFLRGETNIRTLKAAGVNIWDAWVDSSTAQYDAEGHLIAGECPKIYGKQWRAWDDYAVIAKAEFQSANTEGYSVIGQTLNNQSWIVHRQIDQVRQVLKTLKVNPASRRILLNAWNVADLDGMALHPCHFVAQFFTRPLTLLEKTEYLERIEPTRDVQSTEVTEDTLPKYALSCQLNLRSNDLPLGFCFNVAQYAVLTHLFAHLSGMLPERLIWIGGDVHVYNNQWPALKEQLTRAPIEDSDPRLHIHPDVKDIDQLTAAHLQVTGYKSHPPIKFPPAAV